MIDIVFPTFNNQRMSRECLGSLQTAAGKEHRMIFVDNGSTDETREWLGTVKRPQDQLYLFPENTYITGAWNKGVELSSAEIVVIVNNDLLFAQDWLRNLVAPLQNYWDLVSVSVPVCFDNREAFVQHSLALSQIHDYNLLLGFRFFGACFAITREAIDALRLPDGNLFDPEMRLHYQDSDIFERLLRWRRHPVALALNSAVYHMGSMTQKTVPQVLEIQEQDRLEFELKWQGQLIH